jgi:hypothetical protein
MSEEKNEPGLIATIIAVAVVAVVVITINNWLGFFQFDSVYFWKNTSKEAQSVQAYLSDKKPIAASQSDTYELLHKNIENLNDLNELKKTKKQLLNQIVEWTIRIKSVESYGSRYYITSSNESPVRSEAEELGKKSAQAIKGLFGSKQNGNAISMCGGSYVYAQDEKSKQILNTLKEGDVIRIRGKIEGFTIGSSKFGLWNAFAKVGNMIGDEKEKERSTVCIQIDKALITTDQNGKSYTVLSNDTQEVLNKASAIVNEIRKNVDSEKCLDQKIAAYRKEAGEDAMIRADMLNEWEAECGKQ